MTRLDSREEDRQARSALTLEEASKTHSRDESRLVGGSHDTIRRSKKEESTP